MTVRVGSQAALIATVATVLLVGAWVGVTTEAGQSAFPGVAAVLPNKFWLGVIPHIFLLLLGYNLSFVLRRPTDKPLTDLTIWTKTK